jgi:hypothetical protein
VHPLERIVSGLPAQTWGGGGRVGRGVRAVRLGQFERERQLTPHCGSAQGDWVSDNSFRSH